MRNKNFCLVGFDSGSRTNSAGKIQLDNISSLIDNYRTLWNANEINWRL